MNKYLLSICIPTYNREKNIQQLIKNIKDIDWYNPDKIEICITDNNSTDNTYSLIQELQKSNKNISYFKNERNIWMTANFLKAIENGNWEYCWLFWSDDILSKKALNDTLNAIKKFAPSIILSDRYVFTQESELEELNINSSKKDILLKNTEEFFNFLGEDNKFNGAMNGNFFTFISIFCIRKDLYLKNKSYYLSKYWANKEEIQENYFNFAILSFIHKSNDSILILKENILVFARWGNHWWSFNSMKIFNDMNYMIKIFRKEFKIPRKTNIFFNHMLLWWFLPSVMWLIKKNKILKHAYPLLMFLYRPSSKVVNKIFKLFS